MSRKPADKLRPNETRQAIWDWIRAYKNPAMGNCFTTNDVALHINLGTDTIRDYLTGLTAAEPPYLESGLAESTGRFPIRLYKLVRDNGQEAPRVRKDGTPVTLGLPREQMWRALWIFAQKGRAFSYRDLTLFASIDSSPVAETDAQRYCQHLHAGGYLVQVQPGAPAKPAVYRMPIKMWTGPKPVEIQRTRRCFDPNTGTAALVCVMSVEGGE